MKFGLKEKVLIPLIITIVISLTISTTYTHKIYSEAITVETGKGLASKVDLSVKLIESWLTSRIMDLQTWSHQDVYIEALTEHGYYGKSAVRGANEILKSIAEGYDYYDYLFIADTKGKIIASSIPEGDNLISVFNRKYFQKSINGIPSISNILTSKKTNNKIFIVSAPVYKNNIITGVLSGCISISAFKTLFIDNFDKKGKTLITRPNGKIFARSDQSNNKSIKDFGIWSDMTGSEKGNFYFVNNNKKKLAYFSQVALTGWYFIEIKSIDEALQTSYEALQNIIIFGIFTLLLIFTAIRFIFNNEILIPIKKMLSVIRSVEKGKLDEKMITRNTSSEINILGAAFDNMIQRLKETMDALRTEIQVRKNTEYQLQAHKDSLEEQISKRTEDLKKEINERRNIEEKIRGAEARLYRQNKTLMNKTLNKKIQGGNLFKAAEAITESMIDTLDIEGIGIWLFSSEDNSLLKCADSYNILTKEHNKNFDIISSNFSELIDKLKNNRTVIIEDFNLTKKTFAPTVLGKKTGGSLFSSIWYKGQMKGFISFENIGKLRDWEIDEINFAVSTADFISLAFESSELKNSEKKQADLELRLHRIEKMEAIGTLAGGVAHDLNNILSGILSYPEFLLMDIPEDSPLVEPIKTIHRSGQKAAAIVQDLLTLARRGVAYTEIVTLNAIIKEYLNSPEYTKMISFHPGINIQTDLEESLMNVQGSPVHLSKVVMNIVSNAAEAMPDGGIITIKTENRYIDSPISGYDKVEEGDYVIFSVSDTGIGIPEEDLNRIFEPFYTKKKMGRSGTGLGMAVVWGTVKDHNGYIDFETNEGKGTVFNLYFPASRLELMNPLPNLADLSIYGNGERILVVDDIKEQRKIAKAILTRLGYIVYTASSGENAIEFLKDQYVDLIVLDMIMDPGIDGLDTYKIISSLYPDQKVIISSGFSETDRIKLALKSGVLKYIKKPYTIEEIGLAIKTALDKNL